MKAVIYIRVSTDEQAKNGISLDGQLRECQQYAVRNGYTVPDNGIFREEGESAKTANRTQLIALIDYCTKHKGEIGALIVWKVDRFARNAADHLTVKATLKGVGVSLLSVTEPIEDSTTGRLMETMLAGFAQFDNEVRAERSSGGMKSRLEEGCWPFQAPVGYLNQRDSNGRPTLIPSEQAELVSRWFREYLKGGQSKKDMHQMAGELGITNRAGKRLGYQYTCRMLENPIYGGFVRSSMTGNQLHEGIHLGLITAVEFQQVQDILHGAHRHTARTDNNDDWPLRGGFIRCSICGTPVTGSNPRGNGGVYYKYSCPKCRRSATGKAVSADRSQVHAEFEYLLGSIKFTNERLALFREVVLRRWNDEMKNSRHDRQALDREIDALKERKQRLLDLLIDGSISRTERDAESGRISSMILDHQVKRNGAFEHEVNKEEVVEYAVNFIGNVGKLWQDATPEYKQRFQNMVYPDGITYDFGVGFGTARLGLCFEIIQQSDDDNNTLVVPRGFEPLIFPVRGGCPNH